MQMYVGVDGCLLARSHHNHRITSTPPTQLLLIKSVVEKHRIYQLLCSRLVDPSAPVSRAPTPPTQQAGAQPHHHQHQQHQHDEGLPLLGRRGLQQLLPSYRSTVPATTTTAAGAGSAEQQEEEEEEEEEVVVSDKGPTGGRPVVAAATVAAAASSVPGTGWEALTWVDKLEIINIWALVAMAGNVCTLLFTARAVAARDDLMVDAALRVLIGLASLLLWLALIQYLEFEPRYFTLVLTIRRAIPRIAEFLVGILPMFVGYCLLGTILFGDRTEYFGNLSATAATLFCVVVRCVALRCVALPAYLPACASVGS